MSQLYYGSSYQGFVRSQLLKGATPGNLFLCTALEHCLQMYKYVHMSHMQYVYRFFFLLFLGPPVLLS